METTKERAARCDRATHARRSSSLPAYGSRTASITRRRRRAKRKALRAATLAAAVLLLGGISVAIFTTPTGSKQETNILPPTTTVGTYIPDTSAPTAETVEPTEPAVRYNDPTPYAAEKHMMAQIRGKQARVAGGYFENIISASCDYYLSRGLAKIEKTPEPMKPLGAKNRKGQFLACYTKQAQPDYGGTLKGGRSIYFEAKHTDDERIEQRRLTQEQQDDLEAHHKLGAIAFVLVSVSLTDFYRVPWPVWRDMAEIYGRKYMTHAELSRYEVPATAGFIKFLHGIESEVLGKEATT